MRRTQVTFFLIVFSLVGVDSAITRADSPTPETRLQSALSDLNQWVGNSENGQRWKKYLRTDDLLTELARGDAANGETVADVLARYQAPTPGLERPKFRAVERALVAWHATLLQRPGHLAQAARDAAGQFQPVTPQDAAQAKAELVAVMSEVERFLHNSTAANAAAWKRYLGWNDLAAVVQSADPPSSGLVNTLISRLRANQNGLEMRRFVQLRHALENYADTAAASTNQQLQEEYASRVEGLAKDLEAYAADPAAGDAAINIGRTLDWLARRGQGRSLVAAVSQAYSYPNFYGYASERLAATGVGEYINRLEPVRDNILGTDIHGTAHMTGRTSLTFTPNANAAGFFVLLGGQARSNNIGYNRGVTLYTTGVTQISGSKYLQMTDLGMSGAPAAARANTNTRINDIDAKHRIVEKIAWKRASQQQSQGEAIASDHAAIRVARQINQQAGQMIAEQNQRYYEKFRNPLIRKGEFPEELRFSSTSDRAEVRMLQASGGRLGAPTAPPPHQVNSDLGVRAHESVAVNFGEALLGGYYLSDLRLEALLRDDLKTDVPEELRVTLPDGTVDQEKEPWAIQFARELPVRARFDDGGLAMAIRVDAFFRGESDSPDQYNKALEELIEIAADYTIDKASPGATLKRQGDVRVRFPARENPDQVNLRDRPTVTFLQRKFRNLFKEEFIGEGLKFKGRFADVGTLHLHEITSDNAWLTLGWTMGGAPALATAAPNPSAVAEVPSAPASADDTATASGAGTAEDQGAADAPATDVATTGGGN